MRLTRARLALIALVAALTTACMPRTENLLQMDMITDAAPCTASSRILIVFLPGILDTPKDLVREGFITQLRERAIAADVVLADANVGYYLTGNLINRLHNDIVAPAHARGYQQIWLVGISLGAYGAFSYALEERAHITGILAIAPYLGKGKVIDEIAAAGGLANWSGSSSGGLPPSAREVQDRRVWSWLQDYGRTTKGKPTLYLGYGTADDFADSNALVAKMLPASQVMTTSGGHDWEPWKRMWNQFLTKQAWPTCK